MSLHSKKLDHDDAPVGRVLTRREAIGLLGGMGATGLLLLAGCSGTEEASGTELPNGSTSCVAKPELTEGPYFVDERLNRSDIRSNTSNGAVRGGALLALTVNVQRIQSGACTPLAGAFVDVWHCDALGVYSDAVDRSFNTKGENWLRGYQVTDASGAAKFATVFPGWYPGRASHIHFKIRQALSPNTAYDFTSQLFFDEAFLTKVYTTQAPYTTKGDAGRLRNTSDGIFRQGGAQLLVTPSTLRSGGYGATLNVALQV